MFCPRREVVRLSLVTVVDEDRVVLVKQLPKQLTYTQTRLIIFLNDQLTPLPRLVPYQISLQEHICPRSVVAHVSIKFNLPRKPSGDE